MNQKIACLRAHLRNIDRYQNLLKTGLNEIELQFLQRRLSEERDAVAMLHFMGPGGPSIGYDLLRSVGVTSVGFGQPGERVGGIGYQRSTDESAETSMP